MNRSNLQVLSEERIRDGQLLLAAGHWSGAYYLVGYAVECGLKACVLRYVEETGAIFEDQKFSQRCFTHDFSELVKLASLDATLGLVCQANPIFKANWEYTLRWSERSRYRINRQTDAESFMNAVTEVDGVMPWIRSIW